MILESKTINLGSGGKIPTMRWLLFFGSDLRDRDRLQRGAADAGLEVRLYTPGSWEAMEAPSLVVIDLDREGIPQALPEGVPALGYYSHVNETVATDAAAMGIKVVPRGKFWVDLPRLLETS